MEISILALIGIALATMFFGYFFGLFEGRGQGYKKGKREAAEQAPLPPPSAPVAPAPRSESPPDKGLLTLSLDPQQQPALDLDGQRIDTSRMTPDQRRRLIDLMVMMRPWIESGPVQRAQPAPATSVAPPPPSPPPSSAHRPTVPPFDGQPLVSSVPARIGTGPLSMPAPAAEPTVAPTTMVGQIDAILQAKLAGTPLAGRGIRLVESAQGGAMVIVGLNRYAGVGEVPDPEVQSVIRAAIAEWEAKYTPG